MASTDLDRTLVALSDPTRRRVVERLRRRPHRAGELAAAFRMTPPAMSRHLRVLRMSGLVEETRVADDARVRVYQLRRKPFSELQGWVSEMEHFWDDQLASFKTHAEAKASGDNGAKPR